MCNCTINTDVLLANFFAKLRDTDRVSFQTLQAYLKFLSGNFPVYVISDLSASNVKYYAKQYPELYRVEEIDNSLIVIRGEMTPKLDFFNLTFNDALAGYIERITETFLKTHQFTDTWRNKS